ncbi:hypothetical protein [Undibacterium sp. Ji49W]|uniref:hypothetical protein n=1 Tax=Undibacterium sp. Ji49W TaxID=3413040 RepID=UPI003BEFB671
MPDNVVIFKSPEFFKLVKEMSKFERQISKSRIDVPRPGYVMDQWGSYVSEAKVNGLIDLLKQLMRVNEEDEARAARSIYAGLLLTLNRFDAAKNEFKALADERPEKSELDMLNILIIEAKRGNFDEAKRLAGVVNAMSGEWYQITDERIQEKYNNHQKIIKSK